MAGRSNPLDGQIHDNRKHSRKNQQLMRFPNHNAMDTIFYSSPLSQGSFKCHFYKGWLVVSTSTQVSSLTGITSFARINQLMNLSIHQSIGGVFQRSSPSSSRMSSLAFLELYLHWSLACYPIVSRRRNNQGIQSGNRRAVSNLFPFLNCVCAQIQLRVTRTLCSGHFISRWRNAIK